MIALILLIENTQVFAEYLVTIDSSGSILNSFDVGLADGQYVSFIEVDSSGNIWAGRNDTSHYTNQYNPNDMVTKFSSTGSEIATVKGPMRNPLCMGLDSIGNIYIGGVPEGDYLSYDRIFKYDATGNYITTIGIDSSLEYRAIDITSDNRLYATQKNPFLLQRK